MSIKKHGISKNTASNVLLGAGAWYRDLKYTPEEGWSGELLGATSGGSSIKITPEITELELDGALVRVMGLSVLSGGECEAEINFAALTPELIALTTHGELGASEDGATSCVIGKSALTAGDYVDNLGFVGVTADKTKELVIVMEHALCTSGFSIDAKDREGSVLKATFTAAASPEGPLDELPVKIYYPEDE